MSNSTVWCEQGLEPVKQYLNQQGCTVQEWHAGQTNIGNACCVVITGADKNLMGMQDVTVNAPVISADGLTPEQVYQRVKNYMQ